MNTPHRKECEKCGHYNYLKGYICACLCHKKECCERCAHSSDYIEQFGNEPPITGKVFTCGNEFCSCHRKDCCDMCGFDRPCDTCPCHTPPQEKGWIREFDKRFPPSRFLILGFGGGIPSEPVHPETIKSFIQAQITATEERVREEMKRENGWNQAADAVKGNELYEAGVKQGKEDAIEALRSLINNK